MLPAMFFLHSQNALKSLTAGELTTLPRPLAIKGPTSKGRGRGNDWKEGHWTLTMLETD